MDRVRRMLAEIRGAMGRMTATQRLLIGSLCVIALMTLFLVSQYAGGSSRVDLMADDPNLQLVDTLRAGGVDAVVENGRVMVPEAQRRRAVAQLGESGQLPGDATLLFKNLVQQQDWKASRQQGRQQYLIALQNELSRVISQFGGVASATVIIDAPEPAGLGRAAQPATASVTVFTRDGGALPQHTVDAVARLVAGAQSGLRPASVEVIDGSTGQPRTAADEAQLASSSYLEHTQQVQKAKEHQLRELLAYIPGVVVSVSAHVDVTRVSTERTEHLEPKKGTVSVIARTLSTSDETSEAATGGEPGVRSNQQADLSLGGGSSGTSNARSEDEAEYQNAIGSERRQVLDPRGMPTFLAASVSVPQGWVEELIARSRERSGGDGGGDGAEPPPISEEDLQQRFQAVRAQIESFLLPHLRTFEASGQMREGEVSVALVPGLPGTIGPGGSARGGLLGGFGLMEASGPGGGGGFSLSGSVETIVVGVLALVALVMMTMMVRKGIKPMPLPTPEQLLGVPPRLQQAEAVVGEADEGDAPLEGIEIDERQMQFQKMLDQVGELVKKDPSAATRLVGRWIKMDE